MHTNGQGVVQDEREALKWYCLAAEQGHLDAQLKLASMYDVGSRSVLKDDAEAFKWYRRAAERGNARAQFNLARMYGAGRGIPKDQEAETKWSELAATQGYDVTGKDIPLVQEKRGRTFESFFESLSFIQVAISIISLVISCYFVYSGGKEVLVNGLPTHANSAFFWYWVLFMVAGAIPMCIVYVIPFGRAVLFLCTLLLAIPMSFMAFWLAANSGSLVLTFAPFVVWLLAVWKTYPKMFPRQTK
jgi:hypothetical protein